MVESAVSRFNPLARSLSAAARPEGHCWHLMLLGWVWGFLLSITMTGQGKYAGVNDALFMRQSKRGGLTGDLRRLRHAMTRCWETTRSARLLSLSTFHCRCQRGCRPAHASIEHRTSKRMKTPTFARHPLDSLHITIGH